jgi:predicted DNA-binding transcriptional regulator AlpA
LRRRPAHSEAERANNSIFQLTTNPINLSYGTDRMKKYSTREAAKKLGLDVRSIQRYITAGKIAAPPVQILGGGKFRVWTEQEIETVRQLLPKIANGRKTRYQKLRAKQKGEAQALPALRPKRKNLKHKS